MAISYVGASNAAGQNAGVPTPAGTAAITPTLPSGAANGDRIFVVQCASIASGTTPTNWNVVGSKDTAIASSLGAASAGGGQRFMSVYYRDYDGVWTMPSFPLTSATQNSHWIGAIALRKASGDTWDAPTISSAANDVGTADTAHSATTGSSFTTHHDGFLIIGTVNNDLVTSTGGTLTQTGVTFDTITERCDAGTSTGNDVSGKIHTTNVAGGANATLTFACTLSAASQGGNLIAEQTVTPPNTAWPDFVRSGSVPTATASTTTTPGVPWGTTTDDVLLAFMWVTHAGAVTPPAGWTEAAGGGVGLEGTRTFRVFWKRQTSATGAGETTGTYTFTLP